MYYIEKNTRIAVAPFSGEICCEKAGVVPGRWYQFRRDAEVDAEKLSQVNPVGFHVQEEKWTFDERVNAATKVIYESFGFLELGVGPSGDWDEMRISVREKWLNFVGQALMQADFRIELG